MYHQELLPREVALLEIIMDRDGCIGCGACWDRCPEVYEQNTEDRKSQITGAFRIYGSLAAGRVKQAFADCARLGEEVCPVQVISIE